MFKPLKHILFATNLSENCLPAFDFAAAMATRFQATIVLLHVLEKMPDYIEGRLKGMLGQEQYSKMLDSHHKNAQEVLIGKKSSGRLIEDALSQFCIQAGIDDSACGYNSREIVISDGDVVEDILAYSQKYDCEIIIMGAREGLISGTSLGPTIKAVLRRSKVPVTVVPTASE